MGDRVYTGLEKMLYYMVMMYLSNKLFFSLKTDNEDYKVNLHFSSIGEQQINIHKDKLLCQGLRVAGSPWTTNYVQYWNKATETCRNCTKTMVLGQNEKQEREWRAVKEVDRTKRQGTFTSRMKELHHDQTPRGRKHEKAGLLREAAKETLKSPRPVQRKLSLERTSKVAFKAGKHGCILC